MNKLQPRPDHESTAEHTPRIPPSRPKSESAAAGRPWYRERWPWLLMLMPGLAVVGGIFTAYLAVTTNHALVVDEYWREGKAINRSLAKEAHAQALGLQLRLKPTPEGLQLKVDDAQGRPWASPSPVRVHWIHPTFAGRDAQTLAYPLGDGKYLASQFSQFKWPAEGRWQVMVEDSGGAWRAKATWSASEKEVVIQP
jgi:hypothetical protein